MKKILLCGLLAVTGCGADAMKGDSIAKYQFDREARTGKGYAYLSRRAHRHALISIIPTVTLFAVGTGLLAVGINQNSQAKRHYWEQPNNAEFYIFSGISCDVLGVFWLIYGLSADNTSRGYKVKWYNEYRKKLYFSTKTREHVLSLAVDLRSPNRNVRLNALLSLAKYGTRAGIAVSNIYDLQKIETDLQLRAAVNTALNRILGKRYESLSTR